MGGDGGFACADLIADLAEAGVEGRVSAVVLREKGGLEFWLVVR